MSKGKRSEEKKKKRRKIIVKERAFWSMVLSAIEVFHLETLGILLGLKGEDTYVVEYAIPFQTAQKAKTWVSPNERRASRVKKIVHLLPVDVIGDYHSHTEIGDSKAIPHPSGDDIADMEEGNVYIILAVNESEKMVEWHNNTDGSISGTLGGYHIRMLAHEYIKTGKFKYKNVEIICPSAVGLKGSSLRG
ncbi:Mov34/MPN/PAD-1 family protein [candidate division WOR-3 bacterium]|nr:Mov34/MPN/PAD-1 family protein [candidate division WOR-3 bacterium]